MSGPEHMPIVRNLCLFFFVFFGFFGFGAQTKKTKKTKGLAQIDSEPPSLFVSNRCFFLVFGVFLVWASKPKNTESWKIDSHGPEAAKPLYCLSCTVEGILTLYSIMNARRHDVHGI